MAWLSQWLFGWRRNLEDLLYQQSGMALLMATLFLTGLIFGALALRSLDSTTRLDLVQALSKSVQVLSGSSGRVEGPLLRQALIRDAQWLGTLWLLAITLVGAMGVMLLSLVRGFVSGFVVAFLTAEMGLPGLLLAGAGHLPHSLLEVPAVILAATASCAFSLEVLRLLRSGRRLREFYEVLAGYTGSMLSVGVLLLLASLVEAYVTPTLVRVVAGLLP